MGPELTPDINSVGFLFTVCMGIALLVLPRKFALLPIALTTCYMTVGQQILVASLHLTVLRMVMAMAYVRIGARGEFRGFRWLRLDTMVLLFAALDVLVYTLLFQTSEALINRLGVAWDTAGTYFALRMLVREMSDITQATSFYALALVPLAICIGVEKMTGRNVFSFLGGVPEFTVIREGTLRCQGPFRHPILAGTFGAVWLPLFVGLWWYERKSRFTALLGMAAAVSIPLLSGSSGPIVTLMSGALALSLRFAHRSMRAIRWAIVLGIVVLQMVMKEPVWFIFARVNILSGSTGWHRSHLIDETIKHFSEWWLLGINIDEVGRWGVWASDVTNQYILVGIQGGILTMAVFIGLIVVTFSGLGRALRTVRPDSQRLHRLIWALGSAVFAHVMTYMSVSYFDQNLVNWYLLLAMSAAVITLYVQAPVGATAEQAVKRVPELTPATDSVLR